MARDFQVDVDLTPLIASADRFAVQMGRGFTDSFRQSLRGMLRRAAGITPPASKKSQRGNTDPDDPGAAKTPGLTKTDQERGIVALEADLNRVFTGLGRSANRRARATSVSQIEAIHARLFARKSPGRPLRSDRPGGDRYVVDEDALARFRKDQSRKVGFAASGWKRGASILGVTLPGWVNNKDGPGSASIQLGLQLRATIVNASVTPKLEGEVNRRLTAAVRYQVRANERAIRALAEKTARATGLSPR